VRSARLAIVVRFSKSRGRYERQGLLVEAQVSLLPHLLHLETHFASGGATSLPENLEKSSQLFVATWRATVDEDGHYSFAVAL
jgi:hypothetical protein